MNEQLFRLTIVYFIERYTKTQTMKKIDILGKRNQDKMKQMADPEAVIERKMPKHKGSVDLPEELYTTD